MSDPAIKLRDWASGPEALTLTPGEAGLAFAAGAVEPASVGEVPFPPDLVEEIARPYRVRSLRARSGGVVTGPLRGKPRPGLRVAWTTLTVTERSQLIAFFEDVGGTRLGFDVRVDGPGTPLVTLRATEDPAHQWKARHVHDVLAIEAEELFS